MPLYFLSLLFEEEPPDDVLPDERPDEDLPEELLPDDTPGDERPLLDERFLTEEDDDSRLLLLLDFTFVSFLVLRLLFVRALVLFFFLVELFFAEVADFSSLFLLTDV